MHIHRKGSKDEPMSAAQQWRNHCIAKTRARIEHVFGGLAQMGGKALRSIGLARARLHLYSEVAAYNLQRLVYLKEAGVKAFSRPRSVQIAENQQPTLKKRSRNHDARASRATFKHLVRRRR